MVDAMRSNHRFQENVPVGESWSLKCIFCPKFESTLNENKYLLIFLKNFYPHEHRLLVLILIFHSLINFFEIFLLKSVEYLSIEWISLSLLILSLILNLLSLLLINRFRSRLLSHIISLICLSPLSILSCISPVKCHIYLLIMLIYTLSNVSFILSILISIIVSILTLNVQVNIVLLLIVNLIGIYLNRLLDVTIRSSYNQLCKNAIVHGSLPTEHTLISKMIDSLMPRKYAQVIMKDFDVFRSRLQNDTISIKIEDDFQLSTFRPLHIERMENVSILFADIVGFTEMSSNKSASQLVSLLSDLYGRFDDLCVQMSCEKIATLGDCYYCVSGCPEPRIDHAKSCVLMGLAMINAIEEFDLDNNEKVDMRVGVHSGSVNCGIVGTIKFKFDIFSNDVTLANKMESTGKPGYVHITESTYSFVKLDEFQFEEGSPYQLTPSDSIKTYYIGKRRLTHRITRKPPQMTLVKAAAVAVASGVSLSVPLNDINYIPNESEPSNISSPLLEEVQQARRETVSEEDKPKDSLNDQINRENPNETNNQNEEQQLIMPFHILTLKYKENKLEQAFNNHRGSDSLLIIEIILSILSFLLIFVYLPKGKSLTIVMLILISIQLILILILFVFNRIVINRCILIYLFGSFYLLSPLIIVLLNVNDYCLTLPVFTVFISTHLTLLTSISHLIKLFLGLISISIYLTLIFFKEKSIEIEIIVCVLISLIVLYGITRQIELRRRCQYDAINKSSKQRIEIEKERERADWLLRNILPSHVIEPLRLLGGSYSRNHPCVGVLFASLINFHLLYEEQYEGGKFYARILNEFYGDIEELFLQTRFSKIEKIKTIGSTYMAASGLQNDSNEEDQLQSVCDLIEFALAFQSTMHRFNQALLNFEFQLRMGLNFGPVTAGVIGTTKLFYDIWGDTVNVASRMDSTGQKGQIQVPEHVALALKHKYQFQLRGEIDVKGKNRMTTYFLKPNTKI